MSIGPDLFNVLTPPGVWITLHELEHPEAEERTITLRVKPAGRRSVSCTAKVSRYSPETSILQAIRHTMGDMEVMQAKVTASAMRTSLDKRIMQYVEPF